jgi:predicted Zn-dependent protease
MTLLSRIALAIAAAAAIVPLSLWLSATLDQENAEPLLRLDRPRYLERLAEAESVLRDVAERTPSAEPELKLARGLLFGDRRADAARLLREVTAREPENLEGWSLLAIALEPVDPVGAERARARARDLSPPPGRP